MGWVSRKLAEIFKPIHNHYHENVAAVNWEGTVIYITGRGKLMQLYRDHSGQECIRQISSGDHY